MKTHTKFEGGALTLYSVEDQTILGELSDASWTEEESPSGVNYGFNGLAGDGTLNTLESLMDSGVDTVAYDFAVKGAHYQGTAMILKPGREGVGTATRVSIESPDAPTTASA